MPDTLNDRIERFEGDDWWCSRCGQSGKAAALTQPHNQHPNCDYTAIIVPADPIRKAFCAVAKAAGEACADCIEYRHPDFIDITVQGYCRDDLGCRFADTRAALAALTDALGRSK